MDVSAVVAKNPDAAFRRLSGAQGAVLLMLDSGQYHGLNEVGTAIWQLVDGTSTAGEIAAALRGRLDDPPDDLEGVVVRFLAELDERQLVWS